MSKIEIISPLPGTFYRKPAPDAAPFIEIGSSVEPGSVLGLIEVMKQYSDLVAEEAGVVSEILIEDGDPVEAGQVVIVLEKG